MEATTSPAPAPPQQDSAQTATASEQPAGPSGMRQHCFTETTSDATIHFQILDLGRQLYIWAANGPPVMNNLHLAIQTHMDPVPSSTSLLSSSATETAAAVARRLALRVGRPVICSWNVAGGEPMLEAIAEKRLIRELQSLGLVVK